MYMSLNIKSLVTFMMVCSWPDICGHLTAVSLVISFKTYSSLWESKFSDQV